ncbi:hypothetical protein [Virgibacillus sp. DJP39]|uniref:hypothetical protein n=1 Tax=Virgibacillus sp. DJP39 TaxID=3409790 RepID=UPI003BB67A0F
MNKLLISFVVVWFILLAGCSDTVNKGEPVVSSKVNVPESSESDDSAADSSIGLSIPGEKNFKALKKNAEFIIHARVNGDYDTEKLVEDAEDNIYKINRVYTATVNNSFKTLDGTKYKIGDKIKIIYPVGFKQMKEGKLGDRLLPLGDKIVPIHTGEYMLFLDQLEGQFYFSNLHHVYKKGNNKKFYNISSNSIPEITIENIANP